jgi:hypothetical protein
MSKSSLWMVCVLLVALVTLGTQASATLVRSFSMTALTLEAHDIIRGEVISEEVVFDPRYDEVFTDTTIRVAETMSGNAEAGDLVVLRQIGGVLDGVETHVVGTVALHTGDEIVAFMRSDGAFHYLVGMSQGAWAVHRAEQGDAQLHRNLGGITRLAPPVPARKAAPDRMRLETLRHMVSTICAGGGR